MTTNEALAHWRAEYDVTTHVAGCACDGCEDARVDAWLTSDDDALAVS